MRKGTRKSKLPSNQFDFAFIDTDKTNYLAYYKRCMVLVKKGGIIVLDNMLWGGKFEAS